MHRRLVDLLVLVGAVAAGVGAVALSWPQAPALSPQRASWTLTPGVANPAVTERTLADTICKSGWTRTIRPPSEYTGELKLEHGGHPTDPRNLWPEPIDRAEEVDQVENELNDAVCSGRMALEEAQRR